MVTVKPEIAAAMTQARRELQSLSPQQCGQYDKATAGGFALMVVYGRDHFGPLFRTRRRVARLNPQLKFAARALRQLK